jgi:hypothetical protein
MTFEEHAQQQIDREKFSQFIDGGNDAERGIAPQSKDADYLDGYLKMIREMPSNADGTLKFKTPQTYFAFGFIDGVDVDDEF